MSEREDLGRRIVAAKDEADQLKRLYAATGDKYVGVIWWEAKSDVLALQAQARALFSNHRKRK